jgi:hypothetical protein
MPKNYNVSAFVFVISTIFYNLMDKLYAYSSIRYSAATRGESNTGKLVVDVTILQKPGGPTKYKVSPYKKQKK